MKLARKAFRGCSWVMRYFEIYLFFFIFVKEWVTYITNFVILMIMKRHLLLFMAISLVFFLSSCASLNRNSSKAVQLENIIAKIDSKDYVVDIIEAMGNGGGWFSTRESLHVLGDSLFRRTEDYVDSYSPKVYNGQYAITMCKQTRDRRGMTKIQLWLNGGPVAAPNYRLVVFEIAPSGRVRVYMDDTVIVGRLRS